MPVTLKPLHLDLKVTKLNFLACQRLCQPNGWWAYLMFGHVSSFLDQVGVVSIGIASVLLYTLWGLYFLTGGIRCGTPGPNRFGPDALAPPDAANIALPPSPQ
jgi:hypothetical protein